MSYQIPAKVSIFQMKGISKVPLVYITPVRNVRLTNVIVTMFLRGMLTQNWQMQLNVYYDRAGVRTLMTSKVVNNSDIVRTGDWYGEIRFDFNDPLKNILVPGHEYYLDWQLSGAYVQSGDSEYLGLVIDYDSPLVTISNGNNVVRHSCFYDVI